MAVFSFPNKRLDDIEQALAQGQKVVASPGGEIYAIDPVELTDALAGGWQEVTNEEIVAAKKAQEISFPETDTWYSLPTMEKDKIKSVKSALEAGHYIMSDGSGEPYAMPKDEVRDAAQGGWKLWTPQEINQYIQRQAFGEGAGDVALATGAGVARGLTLGMSDVVAAKPFEAGIATTLVGPFAGTLGVTLATPVIEKGLQEGADLLGIEGAKWYKEYKKARADQIEGIQAENPYTSIGGEIAGGLLPAIFTGGGSAAATGGKTAATTAMSSMRAARTGKHVLRAAGLLDSLPAGQLNKMGMAIERSVLGGKDAATHMASLIGGKTGRQIMDMVAKDSPGVMRKILAPASRGAAEGALYGASLEASRVAIQEDPLAPEVLASNAADIAIGGLIGGVGGGFIGGGLGTAGIAGSFLTNKTKDMYARFASIRTGVAKDDIISLFNKLDNDEILALERINDANKKGMDVIADIDKGSGKYRFATDIKEKDIDRISEAAAKNISEAIEEANSLSEVYYKQLESLESLPDFKVKNYELPFQKYNEILNDANRALKTIQERPSRYSYGRGRIGLIRMIGAMQEERKRLGMMMIDLGVDRSPTTSRIIYNIINDAKKDLDNYVKWDATISKADKPTISLLRGLRGKMKDALVDTGSFGTFAKNAGELNQFYSEYQFLANNIKRLFGKKVIHKNGTVTKEIDAAKLSRFLKNVNRTSNTEKREAIRDFVDFARSNKEFEEKALAEIKLSMNEIDSPMLKTLVIGHAIDGLAKRSALQNRSIIRSGISTVDALAGLGPAGFGMPALGLPALVAAQIGKNPLFEAAIINAAQKKVGKLSKLLGKALDDYPKNLKAWEKVWRPVGRLGVSAKGAVIDKAPVAGIAVARDHVEEYLQSRKLDDDKFITIIDALTDPNRRENFDDIVDKATAQYAQTLPRTFEGVQANAVRIVDFLTSKTPDLRNIDKWKVDSKGTVSSLELSKFKKYYAYTINPNLIIERFNATGEISPEAIEVLREVYPNMYMMVVEGIAQIMQNESLPYQAKLRLMRIIGAQPDNLLSYQQLYADQQEQAPQQTRPSGSKKSKSLKRGTEKDMIERHSTAASRTYK